MSWLIFKKTIKSSFLWLKTHWQIPLLVFWTILVYVMTKRDTEAIVEVMNAKKESYKKQIEILERKHRDEILKRENLIEKYESTIKEIETRYEKNKKSLSEQQKETLKDVIIKSKGNTNDIRELVEGEFGFKYVQ